MIKLKKIDVYNLDTSTEQEVFDWSAVHLLIQNEQSVKNNICQYRAHRRSKLLKCAAGCFIPNSLYSPDMEGNIWTHIGRDISTAHQVLILRLQGVHDDYGPTLWYEILCRLAQSRKLSTSAIDRLFE